MAPLSPFDNHQFHESVLDHDIKAAEELTEQLSLSSNNQSADSSYSEMSSGSGRNSFEFAREQARRLATTPQRAGAPTPSIGPIGGVQPLVTPTRNLAIQIGRWRSDPCNGNYSIDHLLTSNYTTPPPGAFGGGPCPPPLGANVNYDCNYSPELVDPDYMVFGSPPTPKGAYSHPKPAVHASDPATLTALLGRTTPFTIPGKLLTATYGYGIKREDGTYTRLIPADELPKMRGLPQSQGPEGLIILPIPHGSSPRSIARGSPTTRYEVMPSVIGEGRPKPAVNDGIQSEIDDIVALSPNLPYITGGRFSPKPITGNKGQRKPKVYCDKWIHDGVCAFTQQGCKYKHEMPMDRATQYELGLFNGLPIWYKRLHGVEFRSVKREEGVGQVREREDSAGLGLGFGLGVVRGRMEDGRDGKRNGGANTNSWRGRQGVRISDSQSDTVKPNATDLRHAWSQNRFQALNEDEDEV